MTTQAAATDTSDLSAQAAQLEAQGRLNEALAVQARVQLKAGQPAAALALAELAVALQPGLAATWRMVASLRYRRGETAAALAAFQAAAEAGPDEAMYWINLGDLHRELGDADAALRALGRARGVLARRPEGRRLTLLAAAYLDLARREEGLWAAMEALRSADKPSARQVFVRAVRGLRVTRADDFLRRLLAQAINETWGPLSGLGRPAIEALRDGDGYAEAEDGSGAADLWEALLTGMWIGDAELEAFLTGARRALLHAAVAGEADDRPGRLRFQAALARQCFLNEYVYALTEEEAEASAALAARLTEELDAGRRPDAPTVVAVAAYQPLMSVRGAERLLAHAWPEPLTGLLREQVEEPLQEAALRAEIPRLTRVTDGVSRQVQDQYEANPYPRWTAPPPPGHAPSLADFMRRRFPHATLEPLPGGDAPEVLIAGCGTGHQVAVTASRFAGADMLAVDLSLASLAYAKRKTEALGLPRVAFGQADILELGALKRSFDVIECTGVLHHLEDPAAGLAVLTGLLRPGGLMLLAFYSETGRRDFAAARRLAQDYDASPAGLRRFRAAVMASPAGSPERGAMQAGDFYTLSGCRDLLFHVQEHRFELPQIVELLARSGLTLVGMDVDADVMAAYRRTYPDDPAATDLANWAAFEADHPQTFRRMYQFWVQKPAARKRPRRKPGP